MYGLIISHFGDEITRDLVVGVLYCDVTTHLYVKHREFYISLYKVTRQDLANMFDAIVLDRLGYS